MADMICHKVYELLMSILISTIDKTWAADLYLIYKLGPKGV
jgi:hypothetical protein